MVMQRANRLGHPCGQILVKLGSTCCNLPSIQRPLLDSAGKSTQPTLLDAKQGVVGSVLMQRIAGCVRGETRYRNAQDEIKATTDAKGEFTVTWPEAGMYWLETGTEDDKTSIPQAEKRRLSYVVTLEVLPQ